MPDLNPKKTLLKKLIQGSASITDGNKVIMIKNLEEIDVDEKEIDEAIQILEEEKKAWIKLKRQSDDHVKWLEDFTNKSAMRIQEKAKSLLRKKESEESASEMEEVENLIDNL